MTKAPLWWCLYGTGDRERMHSAALMPTFHGPMQVPGSHLVFEDMEKFYFYAQKGRGSGLPAKPLPVTIVFS